jgi:hypothetical protein
MAWRDPMRRDVLISSCSRCWCNTSLLIVCTHGVSPLRILWQGHSFDERDYLIDNAEKGCLVIMRINVLISLFNKNQTNAHFLY